MNVTDNFKYSEFKCKCSDPNCFGKKDFTNYKLVLKLEILRELLGNIPIKITSASRCQEHNKKVGGVSDSLHLKGNAIDFVVPGKRTFEYFYLVEKIFGDGGVGFYNGFIHIDTGKKRRWVG